MKFDAMSLALGLGIGLGGMAVYHYVVAPALGWPTFRVGMLTTHGLTREHFDVEAYAKGGY